MDRESGRRRRQRRGKRKWIGNLVREVRGRTSLRSDRKQRKIMDFVYQNAVSK